MSSFTVLQWPSLIIPTIPGSVNYKIIPSRAYGVVEDNEQHQHLVVLHRGSLAVLPEDVEAHIFFDVFKHKRNEHSRRIGNRIGVRQDNGSIALVRYAYDDIDYDPAAMTERKKLAAIPNFYDDGCF